MSLSLAEQKALSINEIFRDRVEMAMATVAFTIIEEVQGQMSVEEMAARENLARRVINDARGMAIRASAPLATVAIDSDPNAMNALYVTFIGNEWTRLAGHNPNLPTV